ARAADHGARLHRLAPRPATRQAPCRLAPDTLGTTMAHPSDHEPATSRSPRHRTGSAMGFGNLLILVVVYAALMIVLALNLSQDVFVPLFAEGGPFESLTIGFWLLLAALCFTLPGLPRRPWDSGIVALLAAAREADLHKAFTDMSVLKTSYYLKSAAPPFEKLIAALVTLPALALVIYVLVAGAPAPGGSTGAGPHCSPWACWSRAGCSTGSRPSQPTGSAYTFPRWRTTSSRPSRKASNACCRCCSPPHCCSTSTCT